MPKIRIGLSTDFNLTGEKVGIGTTNPTSRLDVAGQILADTTTGGGGISTFKEYQGFSRIKPAINDVTTIDNYDCGSFGSLSGEIRITADTTVSSGSTIEVGKTKTLTVTDRFAVPFGGRNTRDVTPEAGTLRFNQDVKSLEFFTGNEWKIVNSYARPDGGSRGVFMGGEVPRARDHISYCNIASLGNTNNFGDLLTGRYGGAAMSSSTRGVVAGGWATPANNFDIEYITMASEGNSIDWGIDSTGGWGSSGTSSSTRGVIASGGYPSANATIESIFFTTVGTKEDWGDLTLQRGRGTTGFNDGTRSIFFGGYNPVHTSLMEYKTTASNGDAVYFGELLTTSRLSGGMSSSTRGITGTQDYNDNDKAMGYTTIQTLGNAQYFGDLTVKRGWAGATSNGVRGLYVAGRETPSGTNVIDYCNMASAGDFVDFGDLTDEQGMQKSCVSDSHGGLGGF